MGTYLSTPVTQKSQESGSALDCSSIPVAWAVVDMQGWRKTMEDAHVAVANVTAPSSHPSSSPEENEAIDKDTAKVFAVFDGHGGPEVARFCQLYFVSVLTQQNSWKMTTRPLLTTTNPAESTVGKALRDTFHALDRMIDHPDKRDELIRLRTAKPAMGERRDADKIPLPNSNTLEHECNPEQEDDDLPFDEQQTTMTMQKTPLLELEMVFDGSLSSRQPVDAFVMEKKDDDSDAVAGVEEACRLDQSLISGSDSDDSDDVMLMNDENNDHNTKNIHPHDDFDEDDDSGDADTEDESTPVAGTAGKVSVIFQRLLKMSVASAERLHCQQGQFTVSTRVKTSPSFPGFSVSDNPSQHGPPTVTTTSLPPSILQNGRMICNLPDHPIHAGATAVCAVLVGTQLTVANAGDSRAVLCRSGVAFPLSFDHKPTNEVELLRIQRAGGFVNHFGRVNGNLNLSRSIGDLKYKQVAGISPSEQIITAEPDLVQINIDRSIDEFILLGCDGIWDCLTNQQAVDFVRARIATQRPADIITNLLDEIISTDPRATQGIGGDNMTLLIVDLQPNSRSYYTPNKESPTTTAEPQVVDNHETKEGDTIVEMQ